MRHWPPDMKARLPEFNLAARALKCARPAGRFKRRIDQPENHFRRRRAAQQRLIHIHQMFERRNNEQHRRHKRYKTADRRLVSRRLRHCHAEHDCKRNRRQELRQRLRKTARNCHPRCKSAQTAAHRVKTALLKRFAVMHLDDFITGDIFFNDIGELVSQTLMFAVKRCRRRLIRLISPPIAGRMSAITSVSRQFRKYSQPSRKSAVSESRTSVIITPLRIVSAWFTSNTTALISALAVSRWKNAARARSRRSNIARRKSSNTRFDTYASR